MSITGSPARYPLHHAFTLLREEGFSRPAVRCDGPEGEVLVLRLPPEEEHRLAGPEGSRISHRLRALGFRYVAVDLAPPERR